MNRNQGKWVLVVIMVLAAATAGANGASDFSPDWVADGWVCDPQPFAVLPYLSGAIAFDAQDNLYATDLLEEYYGDTITVYRYAAPGYDVSSPGVYVSYPKTFDTTSGIDFDGKGNLFVSEIVQSGKPPEFPNPDAGLIRMVAANSLQLSDPAEFSGIPGIAGGDFRATGLAALGNRTVCFPGRKWSDEGWGNIYRIQDFKKYVPGTEPEVLRENLVMYAIADNKWGELFTAVRSIWARNPLTGDVVEIAHFPSPKYVEELAFDSESNLYALEGDDGSGPYEVEILRFTPPLIEIAGCNTGIIDWPMADGTTIGGSIAADCAGGSSPGDFVSCVARHAVGFMQEGLLSPRQAAAVITCAAGAGGP